MPGGWRFEAVLSPDGEALAGSCDGPPALALLCGHDAAKVLLAQRL
jgi:hypothetical protein